MSLTKPVKTPMVVSDNLSAFTSPKFDNPTLYRSLHDPQLHHWQAVKRILRYLMHTSHLGLQFSTSPHFNLDRVLRQGV